MIWLLLSLAAALLYAITTFIDNYVSDELFKNKTPQAVKVVNGISYLLLAVAILAFTDLKPVQPAIAILIFISGILSSLASIPYYLGLKHEEATGAGIYYQLQPIFYLAADYFIFKRAVNGLQILALALIMLAPMLIIWSGRTKSKRKHSISAAILFTFYIFILSLSGIISTEAGADVNYLSMFVLLLLGRGISDVTLVIIFKSWRNRFKEVFQKRPKEIILSITGAQLFNIAADFALRIALIIGAPAIVAALANSGELVFIFLLGIILTKIWPKFGREDLNKRKVLANLGAVILCVIAIVILQIA